MLKWLLPCIPKSLIWPVASTYIAGETLDQCLEKGAAIAKEGHSLAIDILGEHSKTQADTDAVVNNYLNLIKHGSQAGLDFTISLKLSHLGMDTDQTMGERAFERILEVADRQGVRVIIDMESTKLTDVILSTFSKYTGHHLLGTALQSYLRRSMQDVQNLVKTHNPDNLHIRVCKGIYNEPPALTVGSRADITSNYIRLAEYLYDAGAYVCIATHDTALIDHIESLRWDPNRFEFQVLLGVPVGQRMSKLRDAGYKTTVYLPYGSDWHAYSIRRLIENPKLIHYVIKNLVK